MLFKKTTHNTEFEPSTIVYGIDESTGKTKPFNCDYDESRNKVTIIIKENGYYDNPDNISVFNQYFTAVKNHLGIENIGVRKFTNSTIEEFDVFIEDLVKNDNVGYAIIVGQDLPVVKKQEPAYWTDPKTGESTISRSAQWMLDLDNENNFYSYIGRNANGCKDVALSFVFEPVIYNETQKKEFIIAVFSNFINYHNNYNSIIPIFARKILYIAWDDNVLGGSGALNLGSPSEILTNYNNIKFFYPTEVLLNSNLSAINEKIKEKPLSLMYYVHGDPNSLGLGFKDPVPTTSRDLSEVNQYIYTTNEDILNYSLINGAPSLFVNVDAACMQDITYYWSSSFCCWPQTWLKSGVWTVIEVEGEERPNSFEKYLFEEKIVGKALRRTYHNQGMIYGDILAQFP